jgi:hypothetical protein
VLGYTYIACHVIAEDGGKVRHGQGELNSSICATSVDQKKMQSAVCRMKTVEGAILGRGPGSKLYPYTEKQR